MHIAICQMQKSVLPLNPENGNYQQAVLHQTDY